ncbi:MAG: hypothetical protein GY928_10010, partial [Colwellia sp.]|nr:hypothetical protein [Colwellia sp.]
TENTSEIETAVDTAKINVTRTNMTVTTVIAAIKTTAMTVDIIAKTNARIGARDPMIAPKDGPANGTKMERANGDIIPRKSDAMAVMNMDMPCLSVTITNRGTVAKTQIVGKHIAQGSE